MEINMEENVSEARSIRNPLIVNE